MKKDEDSPAFLCVHFFSMIVLLGNITSPPIQIDEEARKLNIWIMDRSQGREELRKFIMTFYDDLSFARFKKSYSSFADAEMKKRKERKDLDKACSFDDSSSEEDSDDSLFQSPFDNCDCKNDTANDDKKLVDEIDLDSLQFNYGESQDLYKPDLPFGRTRK